MKFSSTQFNLPDHLASKVKKAASKIPDWALAEDGKEDEPHVTVKYGLHTQDPEIVKKIVEGTAPFTIRLGRTTHFPDSGSGDVVKADVISRELHALHHKIANGTPVTDTHPGYKPHVTLAYVKPGLGKKFAGDDDLDGQEAIVDHVIFSAKDGTKKKFPLRIAGRYRRSA